MNNDKESFKQFLLKNTTIKEEFINDFYFFFDIDNYDDEKITID
jgi:hypothetical protein